MEFNRDSTPLRAYIIGRLQKDGSRFLANHGDINTLHQLSSRIKEPIGAVGSVHQDPSEPKRNLFILNGVDARL